MEETKSLSAIILQRYDYREADSLVTVYTSSAGRLQLIARGTKKPQSKLAGSIEPITLAEIMIIPGRGRSYLGSAVTRCSFFSLRSDLNKLYYAGQAMRLFLRQTEENPGDEALFSLLRAWLEVLDAWPVTGELQREQGEYWQAVLIWRFLAATGRRPELNACTGCRLPISLGENYFDPYGGGLLCGQCFKKLDQARRSARQLLTISNNCCKVLRFIIDLSHDLSLLSRLKIEKKLSQELSTLTLRFLDFVKFD